MFKIIKKCKDNKIFLEINYETCTIEETKVLNKENKLIKVTIKFCVCINITNFSYHL